MADQAAPSPPEDPGWLQTIEPTASIAHTLLSPPRQGTEKTPECIKLRLARPHPLISATSYKQDTKAPSGHSLPNDGDGADIRVSRPNFRIALAVLDRLFKVLEQRGITIYNERNNYHSKGTYARNNSHDRCQVWLEEKFQRIAHVLTAKEKPVFLSTIRATHVSSSANNHLPVV